LDIVKSYNQVKLTIKENLLNEIIEEGKKHFPNEFGGFLLGYYSSEYKMLHVCEYILPKKYTGLPTIFQRSTDEVTEEFKDAFNRRQLYYVGEWHTHPDGPTSYSNTDLKSMIEIAECETVKIKNPILLIIGISQNRLVDYTFYFYNNKKLLQYE